MWTTMGFRARLHRLGFDFPVGWRWSHPSPELPSRLHATP
jgi:hypothetical protein